MSVRDRERGLVIKVGDTILESVRQDVTGSLVRYENPIVCGGT